MSKVYLENKIKFFCKQNDLKEDTIRYFQAYVELETVNYYIEWFNHIKEKSIFLDEKTFKKIYTRTYFVKECIEYYIKNHSVEDL